MITANSIRLLFCADTHLGYDYPIKPRIERRRRGMDFFQNFQRILNYAVDNKINRIIHGGDLFFRSKIPATIVDHVYQTLIMYADKDVSFYIIPGNHERSLLPSSLFLNHPHVYVFDVPKTFIVKENGLQLSLSGFPFVRENIRSSFLAHVEQSGWKNYAAAMRLLIMHQTVEGAQVGPVNYTFRNGDDVIPLSQIPHHFSAILAGHIHRQQIIKKYFPNNMSYIPIIYPGSIERTSFAEKSEVKGFFDITITQSSVAVGAIPHIEFIPLPTRPMVDISIDRTVNRNNLFRFLTTKISKLDPDSIVRIKTNGSIDSTVKSLLTVSHLSGIFPETMNFQLSPELYR